MSEVDLAVQYYNELFILQFIHLVDKRCKLE